MVHNDHGIGRYDGLVTLELGGAPHDCLRLIYQGGDKLFVPVESLDVLSRYGAADGEVALDKLGGLGWQARKARVKKRIREIAGELIEIAARRAMRKGSRLVPPHGLYEEFAARFPYDETEDQARAIDAVLEDLASGRPMDRLICGDVGFGKTEVALRAAFVVAMAGKQVAILAPTTLLVAPALPGDARALPGPAAHDRADLALRAGAAGGRDSRAARQGRGRHRGRHPRAARQARPLQGPGPRGDRRGAAFRRRPQGAPQAAAGRGPCADHDRDADPAHPADGARRAQGAEPDRDPAGRSSRGARLRPADRSGGAARGDPARALPRRPDLLRLPADRGPGEAHRAAPPAGARGQARRRQRPPAGAGSSRR